MISKEQTIQLFEEVVLPAVRKRERNSAPNKAMRKRVWRNFINILKADGNELYFRRGCGRFYRNVLGPVDKL